MNGCQLYLFHFYIYFTIYIYIYIAYKPFVGYLISLIRRKFSNSFGLVSLFNGVSTFVGYLMPKPSL